MSLKKLEQTKNSKWFSIWDTIVYGVIILTAVVLIISFTVGRDKTSLEGFNIVYNGNQILVYRFGDEEPTVLSEANIEVGEVENGGFTVRFYTDDGKGFNDVYVDVKSKKVSVTASNCSFHKDCVYTPELRYNSSTPIICTPHGLVISPLVYYDSGVIG